MTGMNDCALVIDGRIYGGWQEVDVQRSIEQIAGSFELHLTQKWPGQDMPVGLREGLPCEVRLGDDLVSTGYVDDYVPDLTETRSIITVRGRDKTGDLVDCSAIYKSGAWRGARLERIVRDIATPFGISVAVDEGLSTGEIFKSFSLEDGERAFDAIDRACRLRGVLCTSTPEGNILLTEAREEHSGVTLEEGVNIKRIQAVHSWRDRFSRVTLKAQTPGDDEQYGASAAHLSATATDKEIDRYRPLIVMAEHHTSSKSLRERSDWEVRVRMGRGKRGSCTVVGWRTGKDGQEGPLWRPNTLVRIVSGRMNLDADMLIVGCDYHQGEDGRTTALTFARPEAFMLVEGASRNRRLGKRLGDRVERDKRKRGDGYSSPWDLSPPTRVTR